MAHARSLAAAQTIPVPGAVDANVEQHLRLVQLAARHGAQVLVFPELSLTGYELHLADDRAFSSDDPRLAPLADAAATYSMTLIVGAPVRLESRLYIGAVIVAPDRTIDVYTKHHLGAFPPSANPDGRVPPAEATVFHPGTNDPLVECAGSPAAVAVCADTGRPAHAQRAADRGARAYLASMFVIPSDLANDSANLQRYAARHCMAVVFANFGGPSGGLPSAGRSAIWSERGELLIQLETTGAGVAVASESSAGWRCGASMLDPDPAVLASIPR